MTVSVMGVEYDALTLHRAAERAAGMIGRKRGGSIVTANTEILRRCLRDSGYAAAVNGADMVLADGVGVVYASRILGTPLPGRVAGADLVPLLLERLAGEKGGVFLYGGRPGVAGRAAQRLRQRFPGLRITGTENGYIPSGDDLCLREAVRSADLLLVGLGAPRQELWMRDHRAELTAVMIGVGGLLDVFAGDVPRAPERRQHAGLEWLWRLCREPRRITRMAPLPGVLLRAAAERIGNGAPKGPGRN